VTFLAWKTPSAWAGSVLKDVNALLSDHAYLERKAASNALELFNRWPLPQSPRDWPGALADIAREEGVHLAQVVKLLRSRGGRLQRLHENTYAARLRQHVRRGDGPRELMARILVSALIEERSRERFALLSKTAERPLAGFYRALEVSETGHAAVFVSLAKRVRPAREVAARLKELALEEARIIRSEPSGPRMHSGPGPAEKTIS
jgi:tRNA 2-(methylsulfanyl)-N6-isopentenyladenosine37 hydroxylase